MVFSLIKKVKIAGSINLILFDGQWGRDLNWDMSTIIRIKNQTESSSYEN